MKEQTYTTDNRDTTTTTIHLEDGSFINVDPFDLLINAIENSGSENEEKHINTINKILKSLNKEFGC
jgi:hypothetical protein